MPKKPRKTDGRKVVGDKAPGVASLLALRRDYFLPYQWRWIQDDSPLKLYPKSRRVGVSYATSFRCVTKCMRIAGLTQWVSSKDLNLAQEFIAQYVRKWVETAKIVAAGLGCDDIMTLGTNAKGEPITAFRVTFPNGSRIISLSSNPKAFAGKGGDILIDEMDLHDDQAPLYDMAEPCTTWGGQLEIVSAYDPDGSSETVFAKLVEEAKAGNPKGWSLHETTLEQAVAEGLVEKINAEKAKRGFKVQTREEFIQAQYRKCRTIDSRNSQYCCIAVNAANLQAVGREDLAYAKRDYAIAYRRLEGDAKAGDRIDPCVQQLIDGGFFADLAAAYPGCRFSFGLDIARTGHLASLWIDAWQGPVATLVALVNLHGCKFDSLEDLAKTALRTLPGCRGCGDRTGLGMQCCEHLHDAFPLWFEGVDFGSSKSDLGTRLIEAFEKGWQVLPREPLCVAADIACIRKATSSATKKLVFEEAENQYDADSHADMAWSCALSKRAGSSAARPFAYSTRAAPPRGAAQLMTFTHPLAGLLKGGAAAPRGIAV